MHFRVMSEQCDAMQSLYAEQSTAQHASCSIKQTRNVVLCLELKEHAGAKQQSSNN